MLSMDPRLPGSDPYAPFMSGFSRAPPPARATSFGQPVNVQRGQRRHAARKGIATELQFHVTLRPQSLGDQMPSAEEAKIICPDLVEQGKAIRQLVGLCDRMFRTSKNAHPGLPSEARPVVRGRFFDDARACYRPDELGGGPSVEGDVFDDPNFEINFAAFTEAICGKEVDADAYGTAGEIYWMGMECNRSFTQAAKYTADLIEQIKKTRVFGTPAVVHSYADALAKLDAAIEHMSMFHSGGHAAGSEEVSAFYQRLEARELSLKSARSSFGLVKAKVSAHTAARVAAGHRFLHGMDDDVFARMALYLTPKAAVALMNTCTEYGHATALKARMPHLQVRCSVGNFPHERASSRDREALARNQSKPVIRDFVVSRHAVRLYVDFVLPTIRASPLQKKDRNDGLSNIDHDFSDDEYEDPPEALHLRGPQVSDKHDTTTDWGRKQLDAEQRKRSLWVAAEGPEEKHDRYMFNQRIGYDTFFTEALQITPTLVYADTNEPVKCARFKGGLDLSNQMLRAQPPGAFAQPAKYYKSSDQMPATAKFHIPHLSLDHGGRLFRLRLEGKGTLVDTKAPFSQVVYTEPFEVVSKADVIKKASRRRTVEQVKEDARKRAKAKGEEAR